MSAHAKATNDLSGNPRVEVTVVSRTGDGMTDYLTADEAVHLANRLTDAVDELELAEAVSRE